MSDETPDQVTLDDLPPVKYWPTDDLAVVRCGRCVSIVPERYDAEHERWHAAIEDLTVTVEVEDGRLLTLDHGAFKLGSAAASAQTEEFQPLRDQLIQQFTLVNTADILADPAFWIDQILPVVEAWAEKYLSRITCAELELSAQRSALAEQREQLLAALQVQETGQDIVDLVRELRTEYGKLELRTWTTDQVNARVDERRAGIIALLELAARGREQYAELIGGGRAEQVEVEAETFRNAAELVKDPTRIRSFIPASMLGREAGKLAADEPAVAGVCPSLYLHNGQLLCCTTAISPANEHGHAHYLEPVDGRLNCVQWIDSQAVPVPWPLDQEPPAGITLLCDQDEEDSGREPPMPYVLRAINGWRWSEKTDGTGKLGPRDEPWSEIARAADGELHVVRP